MTSGNTSPERECEKFEQKVKEEQEMSCACEIVVNDSGDTAEQLEYEIKVLIIVKI